MKKNSTNYVFNSKISFILSGFVSGDLLQGIKILGNSFYQLEIYVLYHASKLNKKIINKFKI